MRRGNGNDNALNDLEMVFRSCFSLFTQPFTLSPQASHDQSLLTPPDRMDRNDAEPELKAGCIFCDVSVENGFSLVETVRKRRWKVETGGTEYSSGRM